MKKRLQKMGNSHGIVIPRAILDLLQWDESTWLDVTVEKDILSFKAIIVEPRKGSLFEDVCKEEKAK